MRKSKPVFIYKPSAAAAQLPHLAGLPYGLRVRLRTPWGPWVYAETLAGKLIGLVPSSCIDRS
jgi:hypothetical protein